MTMAWQRNLATATVNLKITTITLIKTKNRIEQDTHT